MIGMIGILGCVIYAAAAITVIATTVSTYYTIDGYYEQKEAAQEMQDLELAAQKKTEKRADFQNALQKRTMIRNSERLKGQMGSAIAMDHLRAKRAKYKTARMNAEIDRIGGNKPTTTTARPTSTHNLGKPTSVETS